MLADEIHSNVLDLVGNTPCVRLDKLARAHGLQCELVAKLEYFNPGGSIKDRIAKNMVIEAEKSGLLKPGDTLVEPTSGNTGIGLAMVAAVRGYNCILTMPKKMSSEKVFTLQALGSKVIRTPDRAKWDSPESHFGVAKKLTQDHPLTHHVLDQYSNPANPAAHVKTTAEEIYRQCGGKLDMIVMSVGTGGTMSGTSKRLKELIPGLKVVAVDPDGSRLHSDDAVVHSYHVEGIGQLSILPKVLNRSIVDEWAIVQDDESFRIARQMISLEGVLCGGSSGTAMAGAIRAAKSLGPDKRCLVVLPDSIRNYFTRFLDDDWMVENGFDVPNREVPTPEPPAPLTDQVKAALSQPKVQVAIAGCAMFALGLALGRR